MVTVFVRDDYASLKKRAEEQALKELRKEFGDDFLVLDQSGEEGQGKVPVIKGESAIPTPLPQKIKKEGEKNEERRTNKIPE